MSAPGTVFRLTCTDWRPVRRDNPNSTLRGQLGVEFDNGLIVSDISVLSSGRRHWVQLPARLQLDPYTNLPLSPPYRWAACFGFRDTETSRGFSAAVVAALLRAYPDALDP